MSASMLFNKIIKHSLFLRQGKVNQPVRSKRKKEAKKKKNYLKVSFQRYNLELNKQKFGKYFEKLTNNI
jgi:hypothetical protein